ncbi:MAG: hypothetical protein LBT25_08885, partial [Candidatus Symbiothrix sp.]|nr:hypothetical protein [Candidatus Symbiothrix sp.]
MKQSFNAYDKEAAEGIAGQARNDGSFCMKQTCKINSKVHENPTLPSPCGEGSGVRKIITLGILLLLSPVLMAQETVAEVQKLDSGNTAWILAA